MADITCALLTSGKCSGKVVRLNSEIKIADDEFNLTHIIERFFIKNGDIKMTLTSGIDINDSEITEIISQ